MPTRTRRKNARPASRGREASAPGNAADAPGECRVHLLDVGEEKYGDCVLCQFGDVSVLIDGSHRGDDRLVTRQLKRLLGQQTLPVRVSLLIVTHPHDDHIGCLASLVANDQLRADWALVADPKFRWGDGDETDDIFAGADHVTRALSEALLEEDRTDWPDEELRDFIDNAGTLVNNYRTMLRQLGERGTTVIRNGTDDATALLAAFDRVGLRIVGPWREHLEECEGLVRQARHDSLGLTSDAFAADAGADPVRAYRDLMVAQADWVKPNKGAINLQSLVTRFEYNGQRFLFAGDMQFSAPEVESQTLVDNVHEMRRQIGEEAPYSLVKISHHGSYNGINAEVLAELGETKLYGICGGVHGASHPHRNVLRLLEENRERLDWVRTDRNGLVSITFGDGEPRIRLSRGHASDPEPKQPDESDFTDALEELAEATSPVPAGGGTVTSTSNSSEVRVIIPPNATRVSLAVDLTPARQDSTSDRLAAAGDLAVAVEAGPADAAGDDVAPEAGVEVLDAPTPSRGVLAAQLNRTRANGWLPFFEEAAERFNWPAALLVAIASRETNIRNILGDGGHGHGIMQIDDRSFPEFTRSGNWRVPRLNILKGAEVLSGKRRFLSGRGVSGADLVRASVAAYNGGEGRVLRAIRRGRPVDSVTAHGNYSADVLARAAVFRDLLG